MVSRASLGTRWLGIQLQIWRRMENLDFVGFCFLVLFFIPVPCGTVPSESQRFFYARRSSGCGMAVIRIRERYLIGIPRLARLLTVRNPVSVITSSNALLTVLPPSSPRILVSPALTNDQVNFTLV